MKKQISFWYPVRTVGQLTFEGQTILSDVPQTGHILHQGRLMCKQSMERLKNECGAKKAKTVSTRIQNVGICEKCQENYKKNEDLDWAHWINPPLLKNEATISINPALREVLNDNKIFGEPTRQGNEGPKRNP